MVNSKLKMAPMQFGVDLQLGNPDDLLSFNLKTSIPFVDNDEVN